MAQNLILVRLKKNFLEGKLIKKKKKKNLGGHREKQFWQDKVNKFAMHLKTKKKLTYIR